MSSPTVIIYHGPTCADGFGAAWWLGRHVGEHTKFAANYDEPPPLDLCQGATVFIVDFCYPPSDLAAIADVAETVDVFDHHETAAKWAADYKANIDTGQFPVFESAHAYSDVWELCGGDRVNIVIDQSHSGVGIVAQVVKRRAGVSAPAFLLNIEDRDLWRFNLPDTKDVFAAVTSRPYDEDAWDSMAMTPHAQLVGEGVGINRYRDQLIEQVAASTFDIWLSLLPDHSEQILVPCASSPYAIGSDVAGRLAERSHHGVGAYCILHEENIQIGLRSRGEGPNVADIAAHYGGGGHPHAAGLRVPWKFWHESMTARG